jgi:NAD(P)-dependent dehydrogenase (short-subunit alcohol dehydrogenase family)
MTHSKCVSNSLSESPLKANKPHKETARIMTKRLNEKVCIITGAAGGQGAQAVRLFLQEGAFVAGFDVNEQGLKALDLPPERFLPVTCDLTNGQAVAGAVDKVVERFGRIDVLYNNAGAITRRPGDWDDSQDGLVGDITEEVFDRNIALNLKSQFFTAKYALPHLIAAGGGAIVNVSSLGGPIIGTGNHAYCTAKAGVVGLTQSLAVSYGPKGIRTNAIVPGVIETPLVDHLLSDDNYTSSYLSTHPMARFGRPDEMAKVGLFLASDEASYVNGAIVKADGGWTVRAK